MKAIKGHRNIYVAVDDERLTDWQTWNPDESGVRA
jgi:hypothetical protein